MYNVRPYADDDSNKDIEQTDLLYFISFPFPFYFQDSHRSAVPELMCGKYGIR